MTKPRQGKPETAEQREARLAEALRANLRRRKKPARRPADAAQSKAERIDQTGDVDEDDKTGEGREPDGSDRAP